MYDSANQSSGNSDEGDKSLVDTKKSRYPLSIGVRSWFTKRGFSRTTFLALGGAAFSVFLICTSLMAFALAGAGKQQPWLISFRQLLLGISSQTSYPPAVVFAGIVFFVASLGCLSLTMISFAVGSAIRDNLISRFKKGVLDEKINNHLSRSSDCSYVIHLSLHCMLISASASVIILIAFAAGGVYSALSKITSPPSSLSFFTSAIFLPLPFLAMLFMLIIRLILMQRSSDRMWDELLRVDKVAWNIIAPHFWDFSGEGWGKSSELLELSDLLRMNLLRSNKDEVPDSGEYFVEKDEDNGVNVLLKKSTNMWEMRKALTELVLKYARREIEISDTVHLDAYITEIQTECAEERHFLVSIVHETDDSKRLLWVRYDNGNLLRLKQSCKVLPGGGLDAWLKSVKHFIEKASTLKFLNIVSSPTSDSFRKPEPMLSDHHYYSNKSVQECDGDSYSSESSWSSFSDSEEFSDQSNNLTPAKASTQNSTADEKPVVSVLAVVNGLAEVIGKRPGFSNPGNSSSFVG